MSGIELFLVVIDNLHLQFGIIRIMPQSDINYIVINVLVGNYNTLMIYVQDYYISLSISIPSRHEIVKKHDIRCW